MNFSKLLKIDKIAIFKTTYTIINNKLYDTSTTSNNIHFNNKKNFNNKG